ncbi:MAG: site-2 protease family protein [Acidobacteriota bacterium]
MFRTAYRLPFRLLGIPVHLDISFLLILPVLAWLIGRNIPLYIEIFELPIDPKELQAGLMPITVGLLAALGLFLSVVIHELGHSVVARGYGVKVKRIVLWVLGGMAQFERLPRQRGAEAVVAIAGPITSFSLASVCYLLSGVLLSESSMGQFVIAYLFYMNLYLAAFNLIPALPLDGGRVLRSLLALQMSRLRATRISASISKVLALIMAVTGLLSYNVFLLLIAFFVYMAVTGESQAATISEVLDGIRVKDLMTREIKTVHLNARVSDLLQKMLQERHLGYPVVNEAAEMVGLVTLDHVRKLGHSEQSREATVQGIMSEQVNTIDENATAWEAFRKMSQNEFRSLMVVDSTGSLTGIISKTDLIRAIQVRSVGYSLQEPPDEPLDS